MGAAGGQTAPPRPGAFGAVRWVLAGTAAQRLIGFAGLAVVARLADEELFGPFQQLVSLHIVVASLLPLGFDQLVVRETRRRVPYARALRGAVVVAWAVAGAAVLASYGPLARGLDLGGWAPMLALFPAILLLQAFKWGIRPLLAADMAFRRISTGEALNAFLMFFGGAALLVAWPSPWALYLAYGVAEVAENAWLWRGRDPGAMARVRGNAAWFGRLAARHRRFCGVMAADQALNTFSHNTPALLMGGFLGGGAVGLFGYANRLIAAPATLLMGAVGRVALPALAGLEEAELRRRVLLALTGSAAFIPPVLLWLAVFAPEAVTVVLGSERIAAAPLVAWLALNLVFQCLFSPVSVLDVLRDRPEVTLYWNAACAVVRAGAIAWAVPHGLVGVVAAYSVASAAMWLAYGVLLAWLLGAGQWTFFAAWGRMVPHWAWLGGAWWGVSVVAGDPWLAVGLSVPVGLAYTGALRWVAPGAWGLMWRLAGRG